MAFDVIGLLDRYENLVASVCYEQIEARTQETCPGVWNEQMLPGLRNWMAEQIVPWMILPYARGAKTRECYKQEDEDITEDYVAAEEEARNMLSGIGTRFDYHVCKSLCDLRYATHFSEHQNVLTFIKDVGNLRHNCRLSRFKSCSLGSQST